MKLAQEIVMFSFILVLLIGIGSCVDITLPPPDDPAAPSTYDVTFTISEANGDPIEGAIISIAGQARTTNDEGQARVTIEGPGQLQTYAVSKDGYRSHVADTRVDRNMSIVVSLTPITNTDPEPLAQAKISTLTTTGEESENPATNAFDGNMNTRWSADVELNDGEQYLELTFAEAIEVGSVRIWWYKGAERTTDYAISTGTGQSRTVHSEGTAQRAAYHDYAIGKTVSVLRITGFGNSQNEWASISEVQINGQAPDTTGMDVTVLEPTPECSANTDCTDGFVCVAGDCVGLPPGDPCLADDDCLEGYLCTSAGECVPQETSQLVLEGFEYYTNDHRIGVYVRNTGTAAFSGSAQVALRMYYRTSESNVDTIVVRDTAGFTSLGANAQRHFTLDCPALSTNAAIDPCDRPLTISATLTATGHEPQTRTIADVRFPSRVQEPNLECTEDTECDSGEACVNGACELVGGAARYDLVVSKGADHGSTVTSEPAGISCGFSCTASFDEGTDVTLTGGAMSDAHEFTGWTGSGCSGTAPCTIRMDQNRSVTAQSRKIRFPVYFFVRAGEEDDKYPAALIGAVVSMNNEEKVITGTNAVVFARVLEGEYEYTVSHEDYQTKTGTIAVNADETNWASTGIMRSLLFREEDRKIIPPNTGSVTFKATTTSGLENDIGTRFDVRKIEVTMNGQTYEGTGSGLTIDGIPVGTRPSYRMDAWIGIYRDASKEGTVMKLHSTNTPVTTSGITQELHFEYPWSDVNIVVQNETGARVQGARVTLKQDEIAIGEPLTTGSNGLAQFLELDYPELRGGGDLTATIETEGYQTREIGVFNKPKVRNRVEVELVANTITVIFDPPECGSANGTYPHTQTDYEYTGATTFCANGLPSPSDIAYPAPGATVNWQCVSGNCEVQGIFTDSGQNCEIETVSCSATREAAPEQSMSRLTLKKAGIGGVTSTSDPNQDAQFNCNALRCTGQSVEYPVGTRVTFTPEPGDGYEFGGWSENCEQLSEGRCAITIDETNPTVTATFEEIAPAPTNYVAWTYIKRCVWGCRIETDTFSGKLVPGQTESHEGTYTIFPLLQPSCGLTIKVTNTDGKISCSEHYRWGDACDEYAFACSEGTDRTAPDMPEEPDQQPAPTPTPTPTPEPEPPVEPTGQVTFSIKEYNSMGTEVDVSARVLIGIPYKKDGYIGLYNAIQDKTGAEVQFDLAPGTYWYTSWGPDGQRFIGSITVAADKEYERKILFPRAMTGMGQYSTNRFSVTIRDQKLDGTDAQPLSGTEVEWGGRPIGTTGSMGKIMQEDMEDNSGKAMLTTDSGYRYDALSFVLTMNAGMEVGLDLEVYPRGKSPPYQPPTSPDLFITRLPPPP